MKKIIVALVASVAALAFFMGCKTVPVGIADRGPVLVLSVTGNHSLPWKEDSNPNSDVDKDGDGDGLLSNLVGSLISKNNVERLSGPDRLDYAVDSFHRLLEETGGVEVVPAETLFASQSYDNTRENIFNVLEAKISANGYKNLMKIGSKRARMIMEETGAKSLIIAEFKFQKTNISGNKWTGKVAAAVTMKIRYLDERGKEIVNSEFEATSVESLPIASRKYDKEALVDLFPDTIDAVINQFILKNL